jgi:hypothetical protein
MNIVIIGDSFGVPNKFRPQDYHLEHLLREKKYNVTNLAVDSGSNINAIAQLDEYLKTNTADWVIWFYSVILTSIITPFTEPKTTDGYSDEICKSVLTHASAIKKRNNIKWAIIGGSSPVPPMFNQYYIHNLLISNWKQLIIKEYLPDIYIGWRGTDLNNFLDHDLNTSTEEQKSTLNKASTILIKN